MNSQLNIVCYIATSNNTEEQNQIANKNVMDVEQRSRLALAMCTNCSIHMHAQIYASHNL